MVVALYWGGAAARWAAASLPRPPGGHRVSSARTRERAGPVTATPPRPGAAWSSSPRPRPTCYTAMRRTREPRRMRRLWPRGVPVCPRVSRRCRDRVKEAIPVQEPWDVSRACPDLQVTTTLLTASRSWRGWTLPWPHPEVRDPCLPMSEVIRNVLNKTRFMLRWLRCSRRFSSNSRRGWPSLATVWIQDWCHILRDQSSISPPSTVQNPDKINQKERNMDLECSSRFNHKTFINRNKIIILNSINILRNILSNIKWGQDSILSTLVILHPSLITILSMIRSCLRWIQPWARDLNLQAWAGLRMEVMDEVQELRTTIHPQPRFVNGSRRGPWVMFGRFVLFSTRRSRRDSSWGKQLVSRTDHSPDSSESLHLQRTFTILVIATKQTRTINVSPVSLKIIKHTVKVIISRNRQAEKFLIDGDLSSEQWFVSFCFLLFLMFSRILFTLHPSNATII